MLHLISLLAAFSIQSHAARGDDPTVYKLEDPEYGVVRVEITDIGEPSYSPYLIEMTVQCKGKKKPKYLIDNRSACEVHKPVLDNSSKLLSMRYKYSTTMKLEAECDTWAKVTETTFKLDEVCPQPKPKK
jgi:hypothetical protein